MEETAPKPDTVKAVAKPAVRAVSATEAPAVDWAQVVSQLPAPKKAERRWIAPAWFALCVLLPLAATWLYVAQIATAQYTASFRYVMQSAPSAAGNSGGQDAGSTDPTSGGGTAAELYVASFMVADYLTSPQAIADIQQKIDLRRVFSDDRIDMFARLPKDASDEDLADYWQGQVRTNFDMMTGLTEVTVRAFTPKDAQDLAAEMVKLSEKLVNDLGMRPLADSVTFLEGQLGTATQRLEAARAAVQDFRTRNRSVDPASEASMTDSLVGKLTDQYVSTTTQVAVLSAQLTKDAPSVQQLERQAKALADEIIKARQRFAASPAPDAAPGSADSYSSQLQEFQDLQLELGIATTNYQSAEAALNAAKQKLSQKHFYVLTYVMPFEPDTSDYPDLFRSLIVVLAVSFCFWIVSSLIVRSMRDQL